MVFRMLKQMFSGEVLGVGEALMSNGMVCLTLKARRDRRSGERYVTLSLSSFGQRDYQHLTISEFAALVEAVQSIEAVMKTEAASPSAG